MREFNMHSTWDSVEDMTINEAIYILSKDANSDGDTWSARPHKAKAAQMAIEALQFYQNYLAHVSTCKHETNDYLSKNRYALNIMDSNNDNNPIGRMHYKHIPHVGEVLQLYMDSDNGEHYFVYTLKVAKILGIRSAIYQADIAVKVEDVIELQKEEYQWEVRDV